MNNVIRYIGNPKQLVKKIYQKIYKWVFGIDQVFKILEKQGKIEYDSISKTFIRDVRGHKFHLNPNDGGISTAIAIDGIRERESVDALYKYVSPNMNILDLGSNIGFYLLLEAQIISLNNGSGRIIGCEPFIDSVNLSRLNVSDNNYNDLCTVFHAAITNTTGPTKMADSAYSNCHQLFSLNGDSSGAYYEVPGFTLVDFLDYADMPIGDLDFLRMDVEGAEYEIIPTIYDFLENKNTFLMFIEFHPHVDREKHVEVLKKLESLGFVCLDATKEYISNDKGKDSGIVKRLHKPDAMINDLYSDSFYTQSGGCEVFLGKGINKQ
jgi:FkbM family methyltransferase